MSSQGVLEGPGEQREVNSGAPSKGHYSQARGMTEKGTYFKVLIEIT